MPFEIGRDYSRLHDIHENFGGQRQSGISPSSSHPFIFIFSGKTGETYGYKDGWQEQDGVYLYSGEGQVGDMEFTRGNRAIRDHVSDGKQLLVFNALGRGKPVRFVGEFACVSYDFGTAPDRDGNTRRTIQFHLIRVEDVGSSMQDVDAPIDLIRPKSIDELRELALKASSTTRSENWRAAKNLQYSRSQDIRAYVLERARGICELTGDPAPFLTHTGEPYLEVHHIHRLADGGLDHPKNCAAITPNTHREIHYGAMGKELDDKLADIVAVKERQFEEHR